jgi:hypothetical protein
VEFYVVGGTGRSALRADAEQPSDLFCVKALHQETIVSLACAVSPLGGRMDRSNTAASTPERM